MAVMKRIETKTGESVWINTENIDFIYPSEMWEDQTVIVMRSGNVYVKGTPDQVVKEIFDDE